MCVWLVALLSQRRKNPLDFYLSDNQNIFPSNCTHFLAAEFFFLWKEISRIFFFFAYVVFPTELMAVQLYWPLSDRIAFLITKSFPCNLLAEFETYFGSDQKISGFGIPWALQNKKTSFPAKTIWLGLWSVIWGAFTTIVTSALAEAVITFPSGSNFVVTVHLKI